MEEYFIIQSYNPYFKMKKGQKVERGQPIPFIMIDQNIEDKQVNYNFRIDPKSFQIFNSEAVKNKKVAIAAIAGPQRTGKSFLSNRLLKKMKGFAIGPTTMPCTKGLWIWGQPIQINKDTVLIIMDTQGLNSVQRDINVDLKIFSLSILLSSVFIYNSIGHIDEKALENMSYVLRISQNLKISSDNDSDNQISKYFPYFYWVLRDFTLDLKGMSQSDYLEESLRAISHDDKDPRNQIRSKIRKLFTHRKCECFPRPVHEEDRLAHIQELKYQDLRDAFKKKMDNFQRTFYSNLPVKVISGKPVTGEVYLNLAHQFVNAMNSGKVPKIKTSFENVITSEIRKACENYQSSYKIAMDKLMSDDKLPLDQKQLQQNYKHFVSSIEKKFQEKFKHYNDSEIFQVAKVKFNEWLVGDYKSRCERNSKISQVKCQKHLTKIFQEIKIPSLSSSESLTTSLIPEKLQQFNKKLKQYFQKEKAPKKCKSDDIIDSVFSQKFPKYIFGYFGDTIAKIKGMYTEQINQLKKETRECRNEIDSVKRVSQEQDNLLLQIRREATTLNDEKQEFEKKIKMQQQMLSLYEEAQNGKKNTLKEKLREYQREISELQEQNNELIENEEKLRNEVRLKQKSRKQIIPTIQQKSQKDWDKLDNDRTPNEVVKTLKNLQNKLDIMNEFYEKKVEDDTIDDILNKQIDKMMTEKYNSIEKAREDFKGKNEELKKKHTKVKQNYERKIEVLSKHLDDIKRVNIDLEKKNNEGPGSQIRIRGLLNERKKFQESLRQKQNTLNSEKGLNQNQKRKIQELCLQISEMQGKYAIVSAENANLRSYPETFNYILRESLYLVLNKNNKLQHSLKSLDPEDKEMIKKTLLEVGVKL